MKARQRHYYETHPVLTQIDAASISAIARKDVAKRDYVWARINQAIAADRYALARRALGVQA